MRLDCSMKDAERFNPSLGDNLMEEKRKNFLCANRAVERQRYAHPPQHTIEYKTHVIPYVGLVKFNDTLVLRESRAARVHNQ